MRYKSCHRSLAAIIFLGISLTVCASLRAYGLQIENPENLNISPDHDAPNGYADLSVRRDTGAVYSLSEDGTAEKTSSENLDNIAPENGNTVSIPLLLGTDILVPGGGHFMRGSTLWGTFFLTMKLTGAWFVYYFYRDWVYKRSLYFSAREANASIDPDHELEFRDPDGHYKTVAEYGHDYDRAVQNITFAVAANVVLYCVSLVINYRWAAEYNADRVPAFRLYSRVGDGLSDNYIGLERVYRF